MLELKTDKIGLKQTKVEIKSVQNIISLKRYINTKER